MAAADLLVHVHIPKCAGTSIWHWMARYMPSAHGFLYPDTYPSFYYTEADLNNTLWLDNTALRCMSSHYLRVYPALAAGRTMRYFTVIRDPLAQFLSYVHYIRNVYRIITNAETLATVPPDADRLSPREIAAWLLDSPLDNGYRESFQSDYLASYEWRTMTGHGPEPGTQSPRLWKASDWAAYRRARLRTAKQVLDRFAVVGTVERLTETLTVLSRRTPSWDVPIGPIGDVEHINVTAGTRDSEWLTDRDPVYRKLLESLAEDYELHAYAGQLLDGALLA